MNRSGFAISSVQHSNSEGLIERQYCQYPLYLYPDISVQTPIWTEVALPSLKYNILNQRALFTFNIVNILVSVPLNFRWNSNMNSSIFYIYSVLHSNSVGLIERCQYPLYLYPDISVGTPIWTVVSLPSLKYSILIQRALLNVNMVSILGFCTLTFPLKLQYEP
jgi:hypothetical protein